jgi:hypothetical protein
MPRVFVSHRVLATLDEFFTLIGEKRLPSKSPRGIIEKLDDKGTFGLKRGRYSDSQIIGGTEADGGRADGEGSGPEIGFSAHALHLEGQVRRLEVNETRRL